MTRVEDPTNATRDPGRTEANGSGTQRGAEADAEPEATPAGAGGPGGGTADPVPGAQPPDEVRRELDEARRRADESQEAVLRARADLDNLRKRMEREVENAHRYGLERFVAEILPVKDSLELGAAAAAAEGAGVDAVREGVELTLRQFGAALEKCGVRELDPVGETFDPQLHQAMTVQEVPEAAPGTVVTVFQKGYLLNERLVRPAMVVVAK